MRSSAVMLEPRRVRAVLVGAAVLFGVYVTYALWGVAGPLMCGFVFVAAIVGVRRARRLRQ